MENKDFFIIENGDLVGINSAFDIPKGTEVLGRGCFNECDFITEINIPSSIKKLDAYIFNPLKNLQRFNVDPQNENFISVDGCIYTKDKKKLIKYPNAKECKTFYVDNETEIISQNAFCGARNVENVCVGKNTKNIERESMGDGGCSGKISKVFIPPSVTLIEPYAFNYYDSYYGTVIGGEKGSYAEKFCSQNDILFVYVNEENLDWFFSLSYKEHRKIAEEKDANETEFTEDFSDKGFVTDFKNGTLTISSLNPNQTEKITVEGLNEKISELRRNKVKNVVIGDGITHLSRETFWHYRNLESLTVGKDVFYIDPECFYESYSLRTVTVDTENKHYKSIDNILYSHDLKTLVKYAPKKENEYFEIPSFVEKIGVCSFQGCNNLYSVKIGNSVTHLGKNAFFDCWQLIHAYIDESVTDIESDYIFTLEDELRAYICGCDLIVGGKKGSATEKLFADTPVSFCHLEDSEIEDFLSCREHYSYCVQEDPYARRCYFAVLDGTLVKYKGRDEEITIPDSVEIIGENAFDSNWKVKKVIIPNSVKIIKKMHLTIAKILKTFISPKA